MDLEIFVAESVQKRKFRALHDGSRRPSQIEREAKLIEHLASPFDLNENSLCRIEYPSGQAELGSEAVDKGPESNALNCPADDSAHSLDRGLHLEFKNRVGQASSLSGRPAGCRCHDAQNAARTHSATRLCEPSVR